MKTAARIQKNRWLHYSLACFSVALALGMTLLLSPWLYPAVMPLFFVAVVVSAWFGGWEAGLLATVLSVLAISYSFIEPPFSPGMVNLGSFVRLSLFAIAATFITWLTHSRRAALEQSTVNYKVLKETIEREETARAESQQAEASLRESEQKYRALFDAIDEGFCIIDLIFDAESKPVDYRFVQTNPAFVKLTGWPPETLGKTARELVPDLEEFWFETYGQVALTGEAVRFENHAEPMNRWFDVYASRVGDASSRRVAIVFNNITDRKRSEAALQRAANFSTFCVSLTDALRPLVDPVEVQATASQLLGKYLGVNRVAYFEVRGDNYVVEHDYVNGANSIVGNYPVDAFGPKLLAAYRSGCTVSVADVEADSNLSPAQHSAYAALQIGAYIGIPLVKGGQLIAGLAVHTAKPRAWTTDQVALAAEVAERTWAAVERARTEAALRESESQLKLASESAKLGLWFWNLETDTLTWTEQCKALFGLPADADMSYEIFLATLHPDDRQRTQAAVTQSINDQVDYDIEYRTRWSDGTVHWIAAKGSCTYDPTGKPIRLMGLALDITDRKQAETVLQASHDTLRHLVENSPFGVYIIDADFRLAQVSAGAQKVFENVRPLIGRDFAEVLHLLWPEPFASEAIARFWHTLKTGEPYHAPSTVERRQDIDEVESYDWKLERIRLLDGRFGVVCHFYDLSERQRYEAALTESEERFRNMADHAPVMIWVTDSTGYCTFLSQSWYNFTGQTEESGLGFGWLNQVHPDDREIARQIFLDATERQAPFSLEYRLQTKQEQYSWAIDAANPRFGVDGEFKGYIGSVLDISDRKQAEAEREQLLEQEQAARETAEQANRIKDEFLAVLSHELRSPLNPILGWSKLLQKGNLSPAKTQQALATIERNAQLQAELIDDLLDVARILRGKLSLTASAVNLTTTIHSAIETVRLAAEAKSITIKPNLKLEVGQVAGDPTRLQQVVWNLLSNAVKFTPTGGQVEVQLEQVEYQVQFTVTDNGKGIAPEFLPYVFDYFRQADSTTTRKFGGLGLGLAIVRQIVELHGGTIWAESRGEGLGASFTVQLPLMPTAAAVNPEPESAATLNLNQIQVLVVDDEADSREFIAFVMEQAGAKVKIAASATEAITILSSGQFDILLSDIGMPDLDGYGLMQQVRGLPPEQNGHIKAIALTAYAGDFNQQQALQAGFQQHVTKPVEPEGLVKIISALLAEIPLNPP